MKSGRAVWLAIAIVGPWLFVAEGLASLPARQVLADVAAPKPAVDPELAHLAQQHVDQSIEEIGLKAQVAFLTRDLRRLQVGQEPAWLADLGRLDPETRQALANVLQENAQPVVKDLAEALAAFRRKRDGLRQTWLDLRTAVFQARVLLFDIQASRRVSGRLAWLLSVDERKFWLFGLIAVVVLLGVVLHDRRHELRRMLNGGRARAMGLSKVLAATAAALGVIIATTFLMGNRIYEALATAGMPDHPGPRVEIDNSIAALGTKISELRKAQRDLEEHGRAADAAEKALARVTPAQAFLTQNWKQFRQEAAELARELALLEALPAAIEADRKELSDLSAELEAQSEARERYFRLRQWIRGILGCALLGLVALGGFRFCRGVRQRRLRTANTCPRCLGRDCLTVLSDRSDSRGAMEIARCGNCWCRSRAMRRISATTGS